METLTYTKAILVKETLTSQQLFDRTIDDIEQQLLFVNNLAKKHNLSVIDGYIDNLKLQINELEREFYDE